jgi:DNA repair protein RadC
MLQRAETAATLAGVDASRAFFAPLVAGATRDTLWVAHVDGQARCIHLARYAGRSAADLPTRDILTDAATCGSAGLVLAYRDRSTLDGLPAQAHRTSLHRLAVAAQAADVTLLDQLVFTGGQCTSMRRAGLL